MCHKYFSLFIEVTPILNLAWTAPRWDMIAYCQIVPKGGMSSACLSYRSNLVASPFRAVYACLAAGCVCHVWQAVTGPIRWHLFCLVCSASWCCLVSCCLVSCFSSTVFSLQHCHPLSPGAPCCGKLYLYTVALETSIVAMDNIMWWQGNLNVVMD